MNKRLKYRSTIGALVDLDLDLESNRQTPRRDITPMEMKGGTTEDDA